MDDVRSDLSRLGARDGSVSDSSNSEPPVNSTPNHHAGVAQLAVAVVLIGLIWCLVLPQIATLPRVQAYTEWLDQRGIDPSAMYYTELDAMRPILDRLERTGRSK